MIKESVLCVRYLASGTFGILIRGGRFIVSYPLMIKHSTKLWTDSFRNMLGYLDRIQSQIWTCHNCVVLSFITKWWFMLMLSILYT